MGPPLYSPLGTVKELIVAAAVTAVWSLDIFPEVQRQEAAASF